MVWLCARDAEIEDDIDDVGVFIPKTLDAALGTFGALYEGLRSKDVPRFPAT